jgi:uncharacterized damage-inducible protein DinB
MDLATLRSLYAYDEWANALFFDAVAGLGEERRTAPAVSSHPSLLATLGHVVGAEWVWLERWKGTSPPGFPEWVESPSLGSLRSRLTRVESERAAFLGGLDAADLAWPLSYRTFSGDAFTTPLGDLLVHVVNHSTYHRGQLTTLLRQAGAIPPASDYVVYVRRTAG